MSAAPSDDILRHGRLLMDSDLLGHGVPASPLELRVTDWLDEPEHLDDLG